MVRKSPNGFRSARSMSYAFVGFHWQSVDGFTARDRSGGKMASHLRRDRASSP
ncbi:hypothetical protein Aros01_03936 [Streptosporangium roseum]